MLQYDAHTSSGSLNGDDCGVLQTVAVRYSMLQCVAHTSSGSLSRNDFGVLQSVAECCGVLQYAAVRCTYQQQQFEQRRS